MSCGCSNGKTRLIYACSGAANTGYLADQVARRLTLMGEGKMTCLAGVGAALDSFLRGAAMAEVNLVIDGCSVACGRRAFERSGLPCTPVVLTDYGVEKGSTLIDAAVIERVSEALAPACRPSGNA